MTSQHAEIQSAANRAIALNPNLPGAYVDLAFPRLQYDHDWTAAADAIAQARALDPNDAEMLTLSGHLHAAIGLPNATVEVFRSAVQKDPLNMTTRKYLARALTYARRPAEAATELRQAIALDP
jgi:tetratricopeptide (TPR) repeat protein